MLYIIIVLASLRSYQKKQQEVQHQLECLKKQENFIKRCNYYKKLWIVMLKATHTKKLLIQQKVLSLDLLQVYNKDGEIISCLLNKPKQPLTTILKQKKFKKLLKLLFQLANGIKQFNSQLTKLQKQLALTIDKLQSIIHLFVNMTSLKNIS